ncbi:hypothetical protein FACS189418_8780 [Clostridia bacterium]|nr:hypothetical protein FACS189418_8780 [Clostridia bacterium]
MLFFLYNQNLAIHILKPFRKTKANFSLIREILRIGLPNGLENSVFQLGKIIVQSLVASFGTVAIAANAVANTFASLGSIPGSAVSLSMITVIGQSLGAGKEKEAKKYLKQLLIFAHLAMGVLNIAIIVFREQLMNIYHLSQPSKELTIQLVVFYAIVSSLLWPESFSLPNALRAAKDVKFTLWVSLVSMWTIRIGFSYLLARGLGMGVMGVWVAMVLDWLLRSVCFAFRIFSGKWLSQIRKFEAVEKENI